MDMNEDQERLKKTQSDEAWRYIMELTTGTPEQQAMWRKRRNRRAFARIGLGLVGWPCGMLGVIFLGSVLRAVWVALSQLGWGAVALTIILLGIAAACAALYVKLGDD